MVVFQCVPLSSDFHPSNPHPLRSQTSLDAMDLDSCEEVMPRSPDSDPAFPTPSSAPSTPHLASTSDAFQFSSFKKPIQTHALQQASSELQRLSEPELTEMYSKAFSDLHRTVAESGEGFIQRMREYEENRSRAGPSRLPLEGWEQCLGRNTGGVKRGRKRPSTSPSRQTGRSFTRQAMDGDDSDVEILSAGALDTPSGWSASKKRAVSLGGLDSLTQGPVAFPALNHAHVNRCSSPMEHQDLCTSSDSSEADSDEDSTMQSPIIPARTTGLRQRDSTAVSTTPPLSFTFSSSANSSMSSLPLVLPILANPIALPHAAKAVSYSPASPCRSRKGQRHRINTTITPQRSRTERAVAALSLALANGAGSVSDYEALRTAQGALALEDHDAGALWD